MSLVEDAAQVRGLQAMQSCGLDPETLQIMLRPTPSIVEEKATAVVAKKKERSELRGELKKRQSKYEKEYAENSARS